jgi:hypothetical protein
MQTQLEKNHFYNLPNSDLFTWIWIKCDQKQITVEVVPLKNAILHLQHLTKDLRGNEMVR